MDDRFTPSSAHSDEMLAQNLHDPIFEPQPSFNFADSQGEDQRGVQPTISSPHAPIQPSYFDPGPSFDPNFSCPENSNRFPKADAFGQSLDGQGQSTDVGGFGATFPNANPMQRTMQHRTTAKQVFGQITPPDDAAGEVSSRKSSTGATTESAGTQASDKAKTDKSERARNAANQRHAKTRRMRKDSQASNSADSDDAEGEAGGDKKERYREKNRLAAAKCRAKKKENIEDIGVKHRNLSAINPALKKQMHDLRGELTGLRTHALNHQDCNCQIARYNINQAKRVALGAEAPSPTMDFNGDGIFSYIQSPPGMGEGIPSGANSFTNPSNFAFASVTTPDDIRGMQSQEGSPQFGDFMPSGYGGQGFSQP